MQLHYCEYDLPARADEDKRALVWFQKPGQKPGWVSRGRGDTTTYTIHTLMCNYNHGIVHAGALKASGEVDVLMRKHMKLFPCQLLNIKHLIEVEFRKAFVDR